MITLEDKKMLAELIVDHIMIGFQDKHLSGNLLESIHIEVDGDNVKVIIDAPIYDMLEFLKNKTIIHKGNGSYASQVNEQGGMVLGKRTHNHIGFVEDAIMKSLQIWKDLISKGVKLRQFGEVQYYGETKL